MLKYFLAICLYCQYKAFELMILAGLNLMKEYLCWGMYEMKQKYRQLLFTYCTEREMRFCGKNCKLLYRIRMEMDSKRFGAETFSEEWPVMLCSLD